METLVLKIPSSRVAEPEPAGAETFGRSRYTEVSAPALCSGSGMLLLILSKGNTIHGMGGHDVAMHDVGVHEIAQMTWTCMM